MDIRELEYYLTQARRNQQAPTTTASERSLEDLMSGAYTPNVPVYQPPQRAEPMPEPERRDPTPDLESWQVRDPETMRNVTPSQRQGEIRVPIDQRIKEHMASSDAAWSRFFSGLGRGGNRGNTPSPQEAEGRVRNQWLNEQRALEALRQQRAPKRADPLKRMLDIANLKKAQAEGTLKQQQIEAAPMKRQLDEAALQKAQSEALIKTNEAGKIGTESERKKAYIRAITDLAGEFKVPVPPVDETWTVEQLEKLATDFAEHPLKYARAKAVGGSATSGKNIAYNPQAQPRLAELVAKSAKSRSRFLGDKNDQEAYNEVLSSSDLDAKQKREIIEQQGWDKEIERTQDRLTRYADETLKKISAPENGVSKMFGAINELQRVLAKYPEVPGWNNLSSTLNSMGKLGQWAVDLSNTDNPAQREIMEAIRKYNEAYRRIYSGAAIADHEKADFAGQLGAGAFSSPEALKQGVDSAEKVLRDGIWNTFRSIDERVWDEYLPRARQFLPRGAVSRSKADSVASKYGGN